MTDDNAHPIRKGRTKWMDSWTQAAAGSGGRSTGSAPGAG